jgi:RNA polymerase sigma-70 factor (ECF subfamily)
LATTLKTSIETLEGFRGGAGAAFAEVVRAYTPMLRSIVSRYWRGAFQREEAMQEIWSLAYRRRESLDPSRLGEFAAWLATLARNRCVDLLRKQGREIGPGFDDPSRGLESLPASGGQERSVEASDLRAAVEAFAQKLPSKWRSFFDLHFKKELGYEEIAEKLNISRARCKYLKRVLVNRARKNKKLMEALGRGDSHAH